MSESIPNPEQAAFWLASENGQLLLGLCMETNKPFYYPRAHSPFTGGAAEVFEASGFGTIYTYSIAYRVSEPYCLAYIQLDEGPIILSNIVGNDLEALQTVRIGQRVKVCFSSAEGARRVPFFEVLAD